MSEKKEYNEGNGYDLNQEGSRTVGDSEFNLANQHDQLERGLKSRHIQFLALGKSRFPSIISTNHVKLSVTNAFPQ